MPLSADLLIAACDDDAEDAGILIQAELEPVAGPGAPVKPAVYSGGKYQLDRRWVGEGEKRQVATVAVIDNAPSQANRLEAQLERLSARLGLPNVVLDLSAHNMPAHLPESVSGFRFPHRQADAYLRDSTLDGVDLYRTDLGRALRDATADRPAALLQWFPQALLFGYWQSHLGKKAGQAKLARSWVSEIVGIRPAARRTTFLGVKGDPLNLSVSDSVLFDADDLSTWEFLEGVKKAAPAKDGTKRKPDKLSEIGHGQIIIPKEGTPSPGGLSFEEVVQRSSVSFAALRRVWVGEPEANAAARALLVALGLVAHVAAFGRPFSLRSGCELRPRSVTWTWLGASADEEVPALDGPGAEALFRSVVAAAEAAGLPVGGSWASEPLVLRPNAQLSKVIAASYPVGD